METDLQFSQFDAITSESYVLDKETCDEYNMTKTKEEVVVFMRKFKKAKASCFKSIVETNLTVKINFNDKVSSSHQNNGGFANMVDNKIDDEKLIESVEPVIKELLKTFTPKEKIYYDYCLANNYSEEYVMRLLGSISKYGLMPIKNSCILKIALAFNLEVLK